MENPRNDPPPSSSSSSSSSAMSRRNYGVFLSFRGPDCRNGIIGHLYRALCGKGVVTFKDCDELEAGQRRSELFDAIEGSRIAVVTFSKDYAGSKWCLNELKKIMECKEQGKLTVVPIFYHVSPNEVRLKKKENGEKGCFEISMEQMEAKYGNDPENVKKWRDALWAGGDLIGFPVDERKDESEVVRDVVERVMKTLNHVPLNVAEHPVGMGHRLREIRPLLHIDPHDDDVYMIGLHGQGGVGKTTLSKEVCNDIAHMFDNWCFLPDVRDRTSRVANGLAKLQQTLLRELLSDKDLKVSSVDAGKKLIEERLRNKRVLVILDDVDTLNQLDALAGNLNWFGKKSRIIITTRNRQVLTSKLVHHKHEVKLLEEEHARNLFCLHAFGEKQENIVFDRALIDGFLKYAGNVPLALKVLGASLNGKDAFEWDCKLKDLAESPDGDINSVLKISFDGLEERHKETFLDIACFFRGWSEEKVLASCGLATPWGLKILIERSLVTVDRGRVQIHDLLEEMGRSVVRSECLNGKEIPSRIWQYEDFEDVLSSAKDRWAVKGIMLNLKERKVVPVKSNAFKGFKNLRVLIVRNIAGPEEPLQLPRELRWLEWHGYSAPTIELDPSSKLACLDLAESKIRQINAMVNGLEELKYINLSGCQSLERLPDLSKCSKLEDMILNMCKNLIQLDEDIGSHENLACLDFRGCYKLKAVPSSLISKHIRFFGFNRCFRLDKLPRFEMKLLSLEKLDLTETSVKELPDSVSNLVALKELVMSRCQELTTIPSCIYELLVLEMLDLENCWKLSQFPRRAEGNATENLGFPNLVLLNLRHCNLGDIEFLNDLTCFETLNKLNLLENKFHYVPACIGKFKNLEKLWVGRCYELVEVSELPSVSNLYATKCRELKTFQSLHTFICQSPKWFYVDLSDCSNLDPGYICRSLPLEKVRGFVGAADVLCPGEKFPDWVNFQATECGSRYRVSLPSHMSEDDVLGLALFVCFKGLCNTVIVTVGSAGASACTCDLDGVNTWFLYLPRQSIIDEYRDFAGKWSWHNFTLDFSESKSVLQRWGMRLMCKREQDDDQIRVHIDEDDEGGFPGTSTDLPQDSGS
ncbi:hypothetical protein MLD38_037673 [Melastoma candidum]|uniref:Uncharacterized protein n=1 Tax=Melastoma candidum TaxID=119954 RepID=A0ACB9LNR3_9MYRT|nr:hypothetical protein MLD38_037673 [Melastoma candidum]